MADLKGRSKDMKDKVVGKGKRSIRQSNRRQEQRNRRKSTITRF